MELAKFACKENFQECCFKKFTIKHRPRVSRESEKGGRRKKKPGCGGVAQQTRSDGREWHPHGAMVGEARGAAGQGPGAVPGLDRGHRGEGSGSRCCRNGQQGQPRRAPRRPAPPDTHRERKTAGAGAGARAGHLKVKVKEGFAERRRNAPKETRGAQKCCCS
jgi:hypothetical protein